MSLNGTRWTTTRAFPTGNAPFAELSAGMTTADTLVTLNEDTGAWNVFWDEVLHYNGIPKAIYQKIENMFTDASVWRAENGDRPGAPGYSTQAAALDEAKKLLQQAIGLGAKRYATISAALKAADPTLAQTVKPTPAGQKPVVVALPEIVIEGRKPWFAVALGTAILAVVLAATVKR